MRYYETVYIVNPNLEEDDLSKTMGEIGIELEKTKSKLINHRVWGKKRLAYPIHKQKYGSFILMQFEGGEQDQMVDFDTWMKLNNSVLRHMTVSLDEKPEVYVEEVKEEPAEETKDEVTTDEMDVAAGLRRDCEEIWDERNKAVYDYNAIYRLAKLSRVTRLPEYEDYELPDGSSIKDFNKSSSDLLINSILLSYDFK